MNKNVFDQPLLLTHEEAASLVRCKPKTLYQWRSDGKLDGVCVKMGRELRYRREKLLIWIDQQFEQKGKRK